MYEIHTYIFTQYFTYLFMYLYIYIILLCYSLEKESVVMTNVVVVFII